MRIVVVSDAHGHINPVEKAIEQSNPDVLIYCGDGTNRIEDISYIYPEIKFYFVKGNCDFGDYPIEQEIKVGSKTVFFTHGHKYYVKMGYQKIIEEGYLANSLKNSWKNTDSVRLLNCLSKRKEEVLEFVYQVEVPFDNNLAERDRAPSFLKERYLPLMGNEWLKRNKKYQAVFEQKKGLIVSGESESSSQLVKSKD